ncbi:MAG: TolC family protein [Bacteroidales bacterium]|jgi:outer membrane protein TolC|nr:TolC family protein [Bacteroidales bacterium]
MMKEKLILVLMALMLVFSAGRAQEQPTMEISLQEALDYALQNNILLQNAALDIEAARKKVWETTAIGLPQVNGNFNYQHIPGELPTFDMMDPTTGEMQSIELGVKNSSTYSLTLSQLIFSGEYIVGLQASKTFLRISQLSHEKQNLETRNGVITSYVSVLILERNKSITDSSLQNIRLLLHETQQLYRQGFMEETDVDQLQITYNSLVNTRKTIERQIDISRKLFKVLLGADLNTRLVLTDKLEQLESAMIHPAEEIPAFSLSENIDFRLAENQERIQELNYKREKTKYLPTISAFYTYQDKTNKAAFDFTINNIVGVNVEVPIFSSFQRNARVKQARIEMEKARNNKELAAENLQVQSQQAKYSFLEAREKYELAEQNLVLSKKVFKNTSEKYKQGMVSSMELTQANNTYLQTQTEYINALFELYKTKIELDKILNEL